MKRMVALSVVFFMLLPTLSFAQSPFIDLEKNFWAESEIHFLYEQGIINGYEDGSFQPNKSVTRAQAAIMIVHALDIPLENRPEPPFGDIDKNFHAYDYVAAVADEGIIRGSNGRFMPNAPLTRGQMAAIIDRAFSLEEASTQTKFKDVERGDTFYSSIQKLAHHRITTGYESDRTFRPNESTSRAQFSVFLTRVLEESFRPNAQDVPDLAYFKELIIEGERTVELAMYEEWEKSFYNDQPLAPFVELAPTFEPYYSEEMIETDWKPFYYNHLHSYGPALAQAFHFSVLVDIQLHVLGPNYVVITGTEPANELNSGESYFEYSLVRTNGQWLIDDISGNY